MVAISLYRGILHRVPNAPRRWIMPRHNVSFKEFRSLHNRRTKALTRLPKGNPDLYQTPIEEPEEGVATPSSIENDVSEVKVEEIVLDEPGVRKDDRGGRQLDGEDDCSKKSAEVEVEVETETETETEKGSGGAVDRKGELKVAEEAIDGDKADTEAMTKVDASNDREKRVRAIEEKLQSLSTKKHNLVQVLKQILNAEEELKRRGTTQAMTTRSSLPLQIDACADLGSVNKLVAGNIGSEASLGGDVDGKETEAGASLNHNIQSRLTPRTSSTSPSSEFSLKRPAFTRHNSAPHSSRATGSPLGVASTGGNLPTVSVSGTNYIASSPSPAASGGTSVFKDIRLSSP